MRLWISRTCQDNTRGSIIPTTRPCVGRISLGCVLFYPIVFRPVLGSGSKGPSNSSCSTTVARQRKGCSSASSNESYGRVHEDTVSQQNVKRIFSTFLQHQDVQQLLPPPPPPHSGHVWKPLQVFCQGSVNNLYAFAPSRYFVSRRRCGCGGAPRLLSHSTAACRCTWPLDSQTLCPRHH